MQLVEVRSQASVLDLTSMVLGTAPVSSGGHTGIPLYETFHNTLTVTAAQHPHCSRAECTSNVTNVEDNQLTG